MLIDTKFLDLFIKFQTLIISSDIFFHFMLYFVSAPKYTSSKRNNLQTLNPISSDTTKTQAWEEIMTSPKYLSSTISHSVDPPFWTSEDIYNPNITDFTGTPYVFHLKRRKPMRKISLGYIFHIFSLLYYIGFLSKKYF